MHLRSSLAGFRGLGCSVPLGVWTELNGNQLAMHGAVHSLDGQQSAQGEVSCVASTLAEAEVAGVQLANLLRSRGAAEILKAIPRTDINAAPSK